MPGQRGRRHLSAGHAVVGIVDEDHRDVLTARRGMYDLAHADGSQVAVALIGEDDAVRQDALDAGRHGRCASVRRFDKIGIEVVVGKHRAAHRRNADGLLQHAHLFQHFGDQGDAPRHVYSPGSNGWAYR